MERERGVAIGIAALAFAAGGLAGLERIGLAPATLPVGPDRHGSLVVASLVLLVATVRAMVTPRPFAWIAPTLVGAGALADVAGLAALLTATLVVAGGLALLAVAYAGAPATPFVAKILLASAALAWSASGVALVIDRSATAGVPWWIMAIVLAVLGERRDLSHARTPVPPLAGLLSGSALLALSGALATHVDLAFGWRALGVGLVGLALWSVLTDRPARAAHAYARYLGTGTTMAYLWLAAGGALAASTEGIPAGWTYDAAVHAIFAGFALTMVFCHAPMVLPPAMGLSFAFTEALYAALTALSGSVLTRVAGDAVGSEGLRAAGAVGIAVAMIMQGALLVPGLRRRRARR